MDGDLYHKTSAEYIRHLVLAMKGCSTVCEWCTVSVFKVLVVIFFYIFCYFLFYLPITLIIKFFVLLVWFYVAFLFLNGK